MHLPSLSTRELAPIEIVRFNGKTKPEGRVERLPWPILADRLMKHEIRREKDGVAFSPTLYHEGPIYRDAHNVRALTLLVLDIDDGTPLDELRPGIQEYEWVAYTTHSHTTQHPKYRLVFRLTQPVPVERWRDVWRGAAALLAPGHVDQSCKGPERLYFYPACPRERRPQSWAVHNPGVPLDPETLAKAAPPEPVRERPQAVRGGSFGFGDYRTLNVVEWFQARSAYGRPLAGGKHAVACPWSAEHSKPRPPEDSDTVVWEADGDHWPSFFCSHAHCQGRGIKDVLELWDDADSYCARPFRTEVAVSVNGSGQPKASELNSLSSLLSLEGEKTFEREWPAPLAPEAFYGRAGEIVQAMAPESEADEAALLVNLLVTFGNVVGRNPHGLVGRTRHGTNLFAVLVGRTGGARKGTSWDPILDLFERALPDYPAEHIKGSVASGEGLISLVRDRSEKKVTAKKKKGQLFEPAETVIEDEGVTDKRLLLVSSEMSELLKVMGRSGNILSEVLRKAWETGNLDNLNKASPMRATGAHLSVIGHITPDGLAKHLTETEAANGFANRFLWMASKRSKALPEGGNIPPLNHHISAIRELVELASGRLIMGRDECARFLWKAVYDDLIAEGVGMFAELTARRAPIVLRLSLVYALFDGLGVVLAEHLLAALAVWERSEATIRFLFGDATGDAAADALYEAMVNRAEGATRTNLHAALGRNRPVAEIDRALTALQRAGKARPERQKGEGGREVEAWYACPRAEHQEVQGGYLLKARAALAEWNSAL